MSAACTNRPVSWLRLERYALGELPATEGEQVAHHLDGCHTCRSALQWIEADQRPLPALPAGQARRFSFYWLPAMAAAAVVVAGVISALVLLQPPPGPGVVPAAEVRWKGGELALLLVRNRLGAVVEGPTSFAPHDRFAARVTCPRPGTVHWELVVYQEGSLSFPLDPQAPLACANHVLLPGAFELTGQGPATVCLVVNAQHPIDRDELPNTPAELGDNAVCTQLR